MTTQNENRRGTAMHQKKVGKPRWGHPLVELVIVGKIRREIDPDWQVGKLVHARAFTHALKGRPREVHSVQPLFRLPRGSTPRSIRERLEFLKLAFLY